MKQDALGQRVGLSQGQISKLENGSADLATEALAGLLPRLASALGTTLWGLVGGTEYAEYAAGDALVTVSGDEGIRWLAYFASALTALTDDQKATLFAEVSGIRAVCEKHHTLLYEPAQYTDPVLHPDIRAERVYEIDRAQVSESDVLILHCDHPSFGAGQELEIATAAGIPVLLLMREGVRVSRMVLGSYARATQVRFGTNVDLPTALDRALVDLFNDLSMRVELKATDIGGRIRQLREQRSLQRYALAQAIGLSEAAVADLENGAAHRVNPSFATLRRVATYLRTTTSYLVDGVAPRPEDTDPVLSRSRDSLQKFAASSGLSHVDTEKLWSAFGLEYQAQRRSVAEARTEPLTVEEWASRHSGKNAKRQTSLNFDGDD